MNEVNKTLYIPLYGKSYVSKRGLFIQDKKAEEIWEKEGFALKGKSKSKWLAFYMGIRSAVFDDWLKERLVEMPEAVIVHIGCGLDGRNLRVNAEKRKWYDVDFAEVIAERKRYYTETLDYKMLAGDVRNGDWLESILERKSAIVVMEGVSMYLMNEELQALMTCLAEYFDEVSLLMDCYSVMAARLSKYKNPINDVGVTKVYGLDEPSLLNSGNLLFVKEHDMTPKKYSNELHGIEKAFFKKLYAGSFSKKLYKTYEYKKEN